MMTVSKEDVERMQSAYEIAQAMVKRIWDVIAVDDKHSSVNVEQMQKYKDVYDMEMDELGSMIEDMEMCKE